MGCPAQLDTSTTQLQQLREHHRRGDRKIAKNQNTRNYEAVPPRNDSKSYTRDNHKDLDDDNINRHANMQGKKSHGSPPPGSEGLLKEGDLVFPQRCPPLVTQWQMASPEVIICIQATLDRLSERY